MTDGPALVEFRAVLHEWARRQLAERSGHTGPFEITDVRVDAVYGYSVENDYMEVGIGFLHTGCTRDTQEGHPECAAIWWGMPDTTDTVTMLNELLALGRPRA